MHRLRGLTPAVALLFGATAASAQANDSGPELLPAIRFFTEPIADPQEPRFAGALIVTDLLDARGPERPPFELDDADYPGREVMAEVSVGATIPLWGPVRWPGGGLVIAGQGGVRARFRIELDSRDDVGQDWLIALPVEARRGDWSGRARIGHRSSHLGDEFVAETDARRIEYGHEFLELTIARDLLPVGGRAYAGIAWVFRSNTEAERVLLDADRYDRAALQAGLEAGTAVSGSAGLRLVAAMDWQSVERTSWRSAWSAALGLTLERGARGAGLLLRWLDGPSPLGQFFATPEQYWGVEASLRF